jgi:hypothetical protein
MKSESEDKKRTEETQPRAGGVDRVEAKMDRDLRDSFPASDPPGRVLGVKRRDAEKRVEDAGGSSTAARGDDGGEKVL